MLRILFALGIAALVYTGGSGTTQAAPILPLPAAATAGTNNMIDVQWGRRCWRDRWGRLGGAGGVGGAVAGARVGAAVAGLWDPVGAVAGVAAAGVTAGAVCVAGSDSSP